MPVPFRTSESAEMRGAPVVAMRARGRLVVQKASTRLSSRLLAAFTLAGPQGDAPGVRALLVPTGFQDGFYSALLQVRVPGTALAGAILITTLTASFLSGIQQSPDVPDDISSTAAVELAGGVPFISDKDLEKALDDAGVPKDTADAVVEENEEARIEGLRAALAALALIGLVAMFVGGRLPATPAGAATKKAVAATA